MRLPECTSRICSVSPLGFMDPMATIFHVLSNIPLSKKLHTRKHKDNWLFPSNAIWMNVFFLRRPLASRGQSHPLPALLPPSQFFDSSLALFLPFSFCFRLVFGSSAIKIAASDQGRHAVLKATLRNVRLITGVFTANLLTSNRAPILFTSSTRPYSPHLKSSANRLSVRRCSAITATAASGSETALKYFSCWHPLCLCHPVL